MECMSETGHFQKKNCENCYPPSLILYINSLEQYHQKPPNNPTHSTRSKQAIHPKALQDIVCVECVNYVG